MNTRRFFCVSAMTMLTVALVSAPFQLRAAADDKAASATGQNDAKIQADLTKSLSNSRFKGLQGTVQNGIVTLNGTTNLYEHKEEADKKAHRIKNVVAVRNLVEVTGPELPDAELQSKIIQKLQYDRVGYGNAFNAIAVTVQNGVVTLGGHALGPVAKDSAISLVSNFPGVKDVVDDIEVDPVSPMDDQVRFAVYRAVYGYPSLNRYAMDPAQTIRISVQNGNVTLFGVVDSQADKNVAGIQANGVPGVFKVTNDLQVANQPSERK